MLKKGVKYHFYHEWRVTEFNHFFHGKLLENGECINQIECPLCGNKTFIYLKKFYSNPNYSLSCSKCGYDVALQAGYPGIKEETFHKKCLKKMYNGQSFYFRESQIPYTSKHKNSHSKYGRSKNGLIFGSYKRSFDEQLLSEDFEIKFTHRHSKEVYIDSGMNDWDLPRRHQPVRSWKRSKKRKQWM